MAVHACHLGPLEVDGGSGGGQSKTQCPSPIQYAVAGESDPREMCNGHPGCVDQNLESQTFLSLALQILPAKEFSFGC